MAHVASGFIAKLVAAPADFYLWDESMLAAENWKILLREMGCKDWRKADNSRIVESICEGLKAAEYILLGTVTQYSRIWKERHRQINDLWTATKHLRDWDKSQSIDKKAA